MSLADWGKLSCCFGVTKAFCKGFCFQDVLSFGRRKLGVSILCFQYVLSFGAFPVSATLCPGVVRTICRLGARTIHIASFPAGAAAVCPTLASSPFHTSLN